MIHGGLARNGEARRGRHLTVINVCPGVECDAIDRRHLTTALDRQDRRGRSDGKANGAWMTHDHPKLVFANREALKKRDRRRRRTWP